MYFSSFLSGTSPLNLSAQRQILRWSRAAVSYLWPRVFALCFSCIDTINRKGWQRGPNTKAIKRTLWWHGKCLFAIICIDSVCASSILSLLRCSCKCGLIQQPCRCAPPAPRGSPESAAPQQRLWLCQHPPDTAPFQPRAPNATWSNPDCRARDPCTEKKAAFLRKRSC